MKAPSKKAKKSGAAPPKRAGAASNTKFAKVRAYKRTSYGQSS